MNKYSLIENIFGKSKVKSLLLEAAGKRTGGTVSQNLVKLWV